MSDQKIRGKCPRCGEMLEIPQGLEKFSCLYCGAKLVLDELAMEYPEGNFDKAIGNFKEHMLDAMWGYEQCQKGFTRKKYTGAFADFKQKTREPFTQLDLACRLRPMEREATVTDAVTSFLDGLQSVLETDKRWKHRSKQERVLFDVKFAVALYLVPAVRDLELSISEDFAAQLHEQWMQRYPKSPYQSATYDGISDGFRKGKLCFITTAVCREEGKPDDCAELTAFRAFRDGYLSECAEGQALIEEYYNIAPAIVTCIDLCDDAPEVYRSLRHDYLTPCYQDILQGNQEACKTRYVQMVRSLQNCYFPA